MKQYFGKEVANIHGRFKRCTYGLRKGSSSVGMDPYNFVTRALSNEMIAMIEYNHEILCNDMKKLNIIGVGLSQKFNHCTILIYYSREGLKINFIRISR